MGNPSPTQGRSGDFRINPVARRKGHRSKFPHRIQRKRHQHRRTMQGGVGMNIRREQWTIQGGVKGRTILSGGDQTIGQSPLVVHATMNGQMSSAHITNVMTSGIPGTGGRRPRVVRQAIRLPVHRQTMHRQAISRLGLIISMVRVTTTGGTIINRTKMKGKRTGQNGPS